MKRHFSQILLFIFLCLSNQFLFAQPGSPVSGEREIQDNSAKIKESLRKVTKSAGDHFKQGLMFLKDQNRQKARENFDKSVDIFLQSGINVATDTTFHGCYNGLIETIFRLEFPSNRTPQIIELAKTCDWKLEGDLETIAVSLRQQSASTAGIDTNKAVVAGADTAPLSLAPQMGFQYQNFEVSPLDELAALELNENEYSATSQPVVKTVKAKSGDTVAKIAVRYNASVEEVAKFNGLYPNKILKAGHEIKIPPQALTKTPLKQLSPFISDANEIYIPVEKIIGAKPVQSKDGKVQAVMNYFNENLHDPYSMKFVSWSPVAKVFLGTSVYWSVKVKYRAKNVYGAYVLNEATYYIQKNKVIKVTYL